MDTSASSELPPRTHHARVHPFDVLCRLVAWHGEERDLATLWGHVISFAATRIDRPKASGPASGILDRPPGPFRRSRRCAADSADGRTLTQPALPCRSPFRLEFLDPFVGPARHPLQVGDGVPRPVVENARDRLASLRPHPQLSLSALPLGAYRTTLLNGSRAERQLVRQVVACKRGVPTERPCPGS